MGEFRSLLDYLPDVELGLSLGKPQLGLWETMLQVSVASCEVSEDSVC